MAQAGAAIPLSQFPDSAHAARQPSLYLCPSPSQTIVSPPPTPPALLLFFRAAAALAPATTAPCGSAAHTSPPHPVPSMPPPLSRRDGIFAQSLAAIPATSNQLQAPREIHSAPARPDLHSNKFFPAVRG